MIVRFLSTSFFFAVERVIVINDRRQSFLRLIGIHGLWRFSLLFFFLFILYTFTQWRNDEKKYQSISLFIVNHSFIVTHKIQSIRSRIPHMCVCVSHVHTIVAKVLIVGKICDGFIFGELVVLRTNNKKNGCCYIRSTKFCLLNSVEFELFFFFFCDNLIASK